MNAKVTTSIHGQGVERKPKINDAAKKVSLFEFSVSNHQGRRRKIRPSVIFLPCLEAETLDTAGRDTIFAGTTQGEIHA